MKSWLLKNLADENRYYPIFLGVLALYALLGCVLFGMAANYSGKAAGTVATLFLFGSAVVAVGMRVAHNLAYAKVNGVHDDKDSV